MLRPFRFDEYDDWLRARMRNAHDRTMFPAGPPDPDLMRQRVEESGELHEGRLDLAIEVGGVLAGEIGTYRDPDLEPEPGRFFVSIGLFEERDRGRGLGTEALRLLTEWLFEQQAARRVEGSTAVGNVGMRRAFEKVGYVFAGEEDRWGVRWASYSRTQ